MRRGLDGRRIALFAGGEGDAFRGALEKAGAIVETLSDGRSHSDADWHGGRYAAIVLGSGRDDTVEPRVIQLVREFLLSGKPVVAVGDGLSLLEHAGGSRDDAVVLEGRGSAADVVTRLADRLEDSQVDEMSDLSFPASDPPANSPAAIGTRRSTDAEAR